MGAEPSCHGQAVTGGTYPLDVSHDPILGPNLTDALEFARTAHGGQARKGTAIPYVSHLLVVAGYAIEDAAADPLLADRVEEVAVAALLHDTVEDTEVTVDEVRAGFGEAVADIVDACTDAHASPKPPWRERKEGYLAHLWEDEDPAVLCVALADKRHNARSVLEDLRTHGPSTWDRFSAGRVDQLWWYGSLVEVFLERRPGPAADELARTVALIREYARD
jgi:GTP pyrophosphokinase